MARQPTAGHLKNTDIVQQVIWSDDAYKLLKNVQESTAYIQHIMYEVLHGYDPTTRLTIPDPHPIGQLLDYAIHIKFQTCGSPHANT